MTTKSPLTDGPIEEDERAISREAQQDEYEFNRRMMKAQGLTWTKEDEDAYWNK